MDVSVIDLCDSDDGVPAAGIGTASSEGRPADDDDSSSSSSSSDDDLWNAAGLNSPPVSKEGTPVRRGNYFKEVRRKYDAGATRDSGREEEPREGTPKRRRHDDGLEKSPIISLDIDDESTGGGSLGDDEAASKLAAAADGAGRSAEHSSSADDDGSINEGSIDDGPRDSPETERGNNGGKKRRFSPETSPGAAPRPTLGPGEKKRRVQRQPPSPQKSPPHVRPYSIFKPRKKKGEPRPVECIEIDLSDGSSDDEEVGADGNSKLTNGPPAKNDPKCETSGSAGERSESEDSDYDRFRIRRLATKRKILSNPASHESDGGSSRSSATVPLPEEMKSPEMMEHEKKRRRKERASFDNKDDDFEFDNGHGGFDEDDDEFPSKPGALSRRERGFGKARSRTSAKRDASSLEEDEEASDVESEYDSDGSKSKDEKVGAKQRSESKGHSAKDNVKEAEFEECKKGFGKSKPKPPAKRKASLKDDAKVLDVESNSDSSSESSTGLYTPRPFKRKAKESAASIDETMDETEDETEDEMVGAERRPKSNDASAEDVEKGGGRGGNEGRTDDDGSDFDASFRIKRPAAERKVRNAHERDSPAKRRARGSGGGSSGPSGAVPSPRGKASPATEERGRKRRGKGRVSFDNKDRVEFIDTGQASEAEDFEFDNGHGGFDEDDEDDDDDFPSKASAFSRPKKEFGKAKSKTPTKRKASSLTDDAEALGVESDDESESNSSMELVTPRPSKKKGKKPAAAAAAYKSEEQNPATKTSSEKKCPGSSASSSSRLATPRAFSPTSTSPTLGAYASVKNRVPTPVIPAMSASLLKEIGGKLYPDLRHNFLVALTSHARRLRNNSYQRAAFDGALRSAVVIALYPRPLRSAEATRRIKGVGWNFHDLLKESVAGPKGKTPIAPAPGRFSCVAAAALVALLELEEGSAANGAADNGLAFPMEDLILKINGLVDSRCNAALNQTAAAYLDPDNLDPGWGQMKKLASSKAVADLGGPFVKGRRRKGACASGQVFELLDSGREMAKKLRDLARAGPVEPGPLRQLPDETVDEEFGNVTMSMDFREGGGGGKSLHKMCDQLDVRGVPYVVRELKIADYVFFVGDKLAPILIERKSVDDVASSLHDGRWERQQRSMRKAQWVLGGGAARRCQICYIIEGDASKKKVHGGNVGRKTYFQSVEDVENAVAALPELGFGVMKTKGHLDTIGLLAKVAQDVSWKAKNKNIDATLTYKEFLRKVRALADEVGDPPTDREHKNPAPPVVHNEEPIPEPSNPLDDDRAFSPDVQDNVRAEASSAPLQEGKGEEYSELKKMSMAKLKEKCKERDEKMSGKKDDLIARLLKPRKPEILIMRARRKEYVPKIPSSNAALMVALLLNHVPGSQGMTKEQLMVLAEETGVSKESMSGDGGYYDGWSGMNQLLHGDPALVRKEKGHRYSLTTQPPEHCGRVVAHALHVLAHREGLCNCGNNPE